MPTRRCCARRPASRPPSPGRSSARRSTPDPDASSVASDRPRGASAEINSGAYRPLIDKRGLLAGATFPRHAADPAEQREALRRLTAWFWHDLSHCLVALGRGQLWWAYGQLTLLQRMCVDLTRL